MTADSLLLVIVGLVSGFALGYVTAWRQARKLEHHGVKLWQWDQHFDPQAPQRAGTVHELSKAR